MVRSSDFNAPETQSIAVFGSDGRLQRRIGGFGNGPGHYVRLMQIALGPDGAIWAADMMHRLTRFSQQGTVLGSSLVLNPGYYLKGLALVPGRNRLVLGGCLPLHIYLDLGCSLVHVYQAEPFRYLGSYVPSDPEVVRKHLEPFEKYSLDVDQAGDIYLVDGPLPKIWEVKAGTQQVVAFNIRSRVMTAMPSFPPGSSTGVQDRMYNAAYLTDRVFVLDSRIVVSVRRPGGVGYLLFIFDLSGKQLTADMASPGRLVGHDGAVGLFIRKVPGQGILVSRRLLE